MLDIYVRISRMGNSSIAMDMEIYIQGGDRLIATGQAIYVGYDAATVSARPVPPDIRELVAEYESTGVAPPLERFPGLAAAVDSQRTRVANAKSQSVPTPHRHSTVSVL